MGRPHDMADRLMQGVAWLLLITAVAAGAPGRSGSKVAGSRVTCHSGLAFRCLRPLVTATATWGGDFHPPTADITALCRNFTSCLWSTAQCSLGPSARGDSTMESPMVSAMDSTMDYPMDYPMDSRMVTACQRRVDVCIRGSALSRGRPALTPGAPHPVRSDPSPRPWPAFTDVTRVLACLCPSQQAGHHCQPASHLPSHQEISTQQTTFSRVKPSFSRQIYAGKGALDASLRGVGVDMTYSEHQPERRSTFRHTRRTSGTDILSGSASASSASSRSLLWFWYSDPEEDVDEDEDADPETVVDSYDSYSGYSGEYPDASSIASSMVTDPAVTMVTTAKTEDSRVTDPAVTMVTTTRTETSNPSREPPAYVQDEEDYYSGSYDSYSDYEEYSGSTSGSLPETDASGVNMEWVSTTTTPSASTRASIKSVPWWQFWDSGADDDVDQPPDEVVHESGFTTEFVSTSTAPSASTRVGTERPRIHAPEMLRQYDTPPCDDGGFRDCLQELHSALQPAGTAGDSPMDTALPCRSFKACLVEAWFTNNCAYPDLASVLRQSHCGATIDFCQNGGTPSKDAPDTDTSGDAEAFASESGFEDVDQYTCLCPDGYEGQYCERDILECWGDHPCQQTCVDIPGSFQCSCRHGYVLQEDGRGCSVDCDDSGLLACTRRHQLSLAGNQSLAEVPDTEVRALCLEYSALQKCLQEAFWKATCPKSYQTQLLGDNASLLDVLCPALTLKDLTDEGPTSPKRISNLGDIVADLHTAYSSSAMTTTMAPGAQTTMWGDVATSFDATSTSRKSPGCDVVTSKVITCLEGLPQVAHSTPETVCSAHLAASECLWAASDPDCPHPAATAAAHIGTAIRASCNTSEECMTSPFTLVFRPLDRVVSTCPLLTRAFHLAVADCITHACRRHGNVINFREGLCDVRQCEDDDLHLWGTAEAWGLSTPDPEEEAAEPIPEGLPPGNTSFSVYKLMDADANPCVGYCRNGGACQAIAWEGGLTALCHCLPGYLGHTCEREKDPCLDVVCSNDGNCSRTSNGSPVCHCALGYTGERCETEFDLCVSSPCQHGGRCVYNPAVPTDPCQCPGEFSGVFCERDLDECAVYSHACQFGGDCHNTVGGFTCSCYPGFQGDTCLHYMCAGSHVALVGSPVTMDTVPPGCTPLGDFPTDDVTVTDCKNELCTKRGNAMIHRQGACQVYRCDVHDWSAIAGFTGSHLVADSGVYILLDDEDPCTVTSCQHGGTCHVFGHAPSDLAARCLCRPGYTGERCETDLDADPCRMTPCQNGGTCDVIGPTLVAADFAARCLCLPGFTGEWCETVIALEDPCLLMACQNGGVCDTTEVTSSPPTARCLCPAGFTGNHCQIEDVCLDYCQNGGTCDIEAGGRITCDCPAGFHGHRCETDGCQDYCQHGATCGTDARGQAVCQCPNGFNGLRCQHEDVCLDYCQNGGTCDIEAGGRRTCDCPAGFHGHRCETEDLCLDYCQNGGTCDTESRGKVVCHCPIEFHGERCENDGCSGADLGLLAKDSRTSLALYCRLLERTRGQTATLGGCAASLCGLPGGNVLSYTPRDCQMYECREELLPFVSLMDGDLPPRDVYVIATMGNNPCAGTRCQHGGSCIIRAFGTTEVSARCFCESGYTGRYCEDELNPCSSFPCLNGGACEVTQSGYRCACSQTFTGNNCQFAVDPSFVYTITMRVNNVEFTSALVTKTSRAYQDLKVKLISMISTELEPITLRAEYDVIFRRGSVIAELVARFTRPVAPQAVVAAIGSLESGNDFLFSGVGSSAVTSLFECSFETDYCGMTDDSEGLVDAAPRWLRTPSIQGQTRSNVVGKFFLTLPWSPNSPGRSHATLVTPRLATYVGEACLTFTYLLRDVTHTNLAVYVRNSAATFASRSPDKGHLLWREGEYSSARWQHVSIPVNVSEDTLFAFEGLISGVSDVIAIDNITLTAGQCEVSYLADNTDCPLHAMTPHDTSCLDLLWGTHCMPGAPGDPRDNPDARERFDLYTLHAVGQQIGAMARAASRSASWDCYGDITHHVRLMTGDTHSHSGAGRLEVFHDGHWGSVCGEGLGPGVASVVCRALGHAPRGYARPGAAFGPGRGGVLLTWLRCAGHERSLFECDYEAGDVSCDHRDYVGVICELATPGVQVLGGPLADRPDNAHYRQSAVIPGTRQSVTSPGRLLSWQFYSLVGGGDLDLQVWRRVAGASASTNQRFRLVSTTHVTTTEGIQATNVTLRPDPQPEVFAGDVIGFYSGEATSPIGYTLTECEDPGDRTQYASPGTRTLGVGDELPFATVPNLSGPCREYSLQVTIALDDDSTGVDESNKTTIAQPRSQSSDDLFACDFEHGDRCGLHPVVPGAGGEVAPYTWAIRSGPTPTSGTGPPGAARGGHYVYAEASGTAPGRTAIMTSPPIDTRNQSFCLSFRYNLHGATTGSLSAYIRVVGDDVWRLVFEESGPGTEAWRLARINGTLEGPIQVLWRATRGLDARGDIALDDIAVSATSCAPGRPPDGDTESDAQVEPAQDRHECYVSRESGADVAGCGTAVSPCSTLRAALTNTNFLKVEITLISVAAYDNELYNLSASDIDLRDVTVRGQGPGARPPGIRLTDTLPLTASPRGSLRRLSLADLTIEGSLDILCPESSALELSLSDVSWNSGGLAISRCDDTRVTVSASNFTARGLAIESLRKTKVLIKDSRFQFADRSPRGRRSVTGRDGGLQFLFPAAGRRDGRHVIRVTNSIIEGAGHGGPAERVEVIAAYGKVTGAMTLWAPGRDSHVTVSVRDSQFVGNSRALDVAARGRLELDISRCRFAGNEAIGAGGAIRVTSSEDGPVGQHSDVEAARVRIRSCTFLSNAARPHPVDDAVRMEPMRMRSNGGAIYMHVTLPTLAKSSGYLEITDSVFRDNVAGMEGSALFVGPGASCLLNGCTIEGSSVASGAAELIEAAGHVRINDTKVKVTRMSDATAPVFRYQSRDTSNTDLSANMIFTCAPGHMIREKSRPSGSVLGGLEALSVYCEPCADGRYSLDLDSIVISNANRTTSLVSRDPITCLTCPSGAECARGAIRNKDGFWGFTRPILTTELREAATVAVTMVSCPDDYCARNLTDVTGSLTSCQPHRSGTLCGACRPGWSESLVTTRCVPDADCGVIRNPVQILTVALYGLILVLFFMFEHDMSRALVVFVHRFVKSRWNDRGVVQKSPLAEYGYFQIFMYFIQVASLLKVKSAVTDHWLRASSHVRTPSEIFPDALLYSTRDFFNFNFIDIEWNFCFFPGVDAVGKVGFKLLLFVYQYVLLALVCLLAYGCRALFKLPRAQQIGSYGFDARFLCTILALFLYTFQSIAQSTLTLLSCQDVGGQMLLHIDANVVCLQAWQWLPVMLFAVYVAPFFVVLLLAPRLLAVGRISVTWFYLSLSLPLFFSPVLCWKFHLWRTQERAQRLSALEEEYKATELKVTQEGGGGGGKQSKQGKAPPKGDPEQRDSIDSGMSTFSVQWRPDDVTCAGTGRTFCAPCTEPGCLEGWDSHFRQPAENVEAISGVLSAPYRDDVWGGVCWEGVLTLQRLVYVFLITYATERLLRHILLTSGCLAFLLLHLAVRPFRSRLPNLLQAASLSLLLLLATLGLVRVALTSSTGRPGFVSCVVIAGCEWLDVMVCVLLPATVGVALLVWGVVKPCLEAKHKRRTVRALMKQRKRPSLTPEPASAKQPESPWTLTRPFPAAAVRLPKHRSTSPSLDPDSRIRIPISRSQAESGDDASIPTWTNIYSNLDWVPSPMTPLPGLSYPAFVGSPVTTFTGPRAATGRPSGVGAPQAATPRVNSYPELRSLTTTPYLTDGRPYPRLSPVKSLLPPFDYPDDVQMSPRRTSGCYGDAGESEDEYVTSFYNRHGVRLVTSPSASRLPRMSFHSPS